VLALLLARGAPPSRSRSRSQQAERT